MKLLTTLMLSLLICILSYEHANAAKRAWVAVPDGNGGYTVIFYDNTPPAPRKPKPLDNWDRARRDYMTSRYGKKVSDFYYKGEDEARERARGTSRPGIGAVYIPNPYTPTPRANSNSYLHHNEKVNTNRYER